MRPWRARGCLPAPRGARARRRGGRFEGGREPRRRAFYSCGGDVPRTCRAETDRPACLRSSAGELRRALLEERGDPLAEVAGRRHLLLDAGLELELLVEPGVQPGVDLALGARVGLRRTGGELIEH